MLAACRGAAEAASVDYPRLVYPYIEKEMKLATLLPMQRVCALAKVSRAGFYRWRHAPPAANADVDLRDEIQRVALEWPCYGSRRVKAELRRRGWAVGRERVQRWMREDNLLCLRRRKFVVDAMHHKRANRERVGTVPFGYRLAADGVHIEADPAEQAIQARARELKQTGLTTRRIAAELNREGYVTRRGTAWRFQAVRHGVSSMSRMH
jgi:hypothetical protein